MNAAELLLLIGGLGAAIHHAIERVQGNKAQCKRLGRRIEVIIAELNTLDLTKTSKHFVIELLTLKGHIEKCQAFIQGFTQKGKFKKWLLSKKYQRQFEALNNILNEDVNQLHLGIDIQQLFNQEDDRADMKKDREYLEKLMEQQEVILQQLEKGEVKLKDISKDQKEMLNLAQEWHDRQLQLLVQMEKGEKKIDQVGAGIKQILRIMRERLTGSSMEKKVGSSDSHHGLEKYALIDPSTLTYDPSSIIYEDEAAVIYRGKWHDEVVAIKQFKDLITEAQYNQFIREIQIMYRLRHNQILPLYGACTQVDHECIVIPYMETSLEDWLKQRKKLTPEKQHQIALEIAQGLCYLHSQQIVHSDLHRRHVLLDKAGHTKITGFRLAHTKTASIKSIHEESGELCYLAPEILDRSPACYTDKTDVYSYGILLSELFLQKQFSAKEMEGGEKSIVAFRKQLQTEIKAKSGQAIPAFYADLILDCLNESPTARPSMEEIRRQLKKQTLEILFDMAVAKERESLLSEAMEHYEEAATKGYTRAKTNLGMLFLSGKTGITDKPRAYSLLTEAAEAGHARAQFNLGMMLEYGDGIPKDYHKAMMWYQSASKNGHKDALTCSTRLATKMANMKL